MSRFIPQKLMQTILICLSFLFIIYYFSQHQDEFFQLFHLKPEYLFPSFIICIFIHLLTSIKYLILLRKNGLKNMDALTWLKIFSISRFLNFHLTQGANIYRSVKLKKEYNFSFTHSLSLMTFFTWVDIIVISLISITLISILPTDIPSLKFKIILLIAGLLVFIILLPLISKSLLNSLRPKHQKLVWIHQKLNDFSGQFILNTRNSSTLFLISVINLLIYFLFAIQIQFTFNALHFAILFSNTCIYTTFTLLSGLVNITPNNLGITELIYGYLSSSLNNTIGTGIIAYSLIRLIWYVVSILFLLCFIKTFNKDKKLLKENILDSPNAA